MIEELPAEGEEFGARGAAADLVEELPGRFHAEADEIHILLHIVDLGGFPDAGRADRFVKRVHIFEHVTPSRAEHGRTAALLANLPEKPGIADDAAADHEPARAGERENFVRFVSGIDVAVCQHWERQRGDGARDEVVAGHAPIHLFHSPRVDGEQVERMAGEDRQELVEDRGVIKTDPCFHGERDRDRFAQRAQDRVDALRLAKQTPTRAFATHDRHRTPEVQIDRRDGMLLQLARGADKRRDVVADHLRDDRPAGRVLRDGRKNLRIEPRIGQDPEVFGEINVGVPVTADQPHEAQVRHILHRREREDRLVAAEQLLEFVAHNLINQESRKTRSRSPGLQISSYCGLRAEQICPDSKTDSFYPPLSQATPSD